MNKLMIAFTTTVATLLITPDAGAAPALTPVPLKDVKLDDGPRGFWRPKREIWRTVTITDCFDKFERDGALRNFDKVRDGVTGAHGGPPWYDGLIYEMITAAADFLADRRDERLERRIDGYVERIAAAAAKDPDGYVNTYTQSKEPNHRWGANGGNDRWQHDLYNAGCLVEAGVHYYRATGKPELLRVAVRLANHMCDVMGPTPRKNIIPGHAIGELAMSELDALFKAEPGLKDKLGVPVDEARYLSLAQFWVDNRGHHEGRQDFGAYDQDDVPVARQPAIEGHAVRATLLAAGVTALAGTARRDDYTQISRRLWENMIGRRMYVTGGVGAIAGDERFGDDYVLPSNGYLETCAAVGAAYFHEQMFLSNGAGDARYGDELERAIYNAALCGVSLSGNRYFYENPLEAGKGRVRWTWHECPCCPPMFLKLMGALPGYIYATGPSGLYVNLYAGSVAHATLGGETIVVKQTTAYPWEGDVRLSIERSGSTEFELALRVPAWCQAAERADELYTPVGRPRADAFVVTVNGRPAMPQFDGGYARVRRAWANGDVIEIKTAMPPRRVTANAKIAATAGRVALSRGPLVYCVESIDNGGRVRNLSLPDDAKLTTEFRGGLLGGVVAIHAAALSSLAGADAPRPAELTAIPYYANANRGPVSMRVWLPRSPADALPASLAESATASASHTNPSDTLDALNSGRVPKASDDESIPRFTWWDHRGTTEWVQYTFDKPQAVSAASVYWWDERRVGRHCRVPASWRLQYKTPAGEWADVHNASAYGTAIDQFNRATFDRVETTAIRVQAKLQPQWSGGILAWRVDDSPVAATSTTSSPPAPGH